MSLTQGSSVSVGVPFGARSLPEVWSLLAMAGGLEHPWTLPTSPMRQLKMSPKIALCPLGEQYIASGGEPEF